MLRAAGTNKLGALIEVRKGSGRNVERRNLIRLENFYRRREIAARMVPPWPQTGSCGQNSMLE
jgi:hypothetical protein